MAQPYFKMPEAEPGMFVYWYPGGERNQTPHCAIVTSIGFDSLCLSLVEPNNYNLAILDGVRHLDDPRARAPEMQENGAWDYTKQHKRLMKMEERVMELEELLLEKATA